MQLPLMHFTDMYCLTPGEIAFLQTLVGGKNCKNKSIKFLNLCMASMQMSTFTDVASPSRSVQNTYSWI